jgi:hypothetical protein
MRGCFDDPAFGFHSRAAELPQQRIDGGAVLAEPGRKHTAVDCTAAVP